MNPLAEPMPARVAALRIDGERLSGTLMKLARAGATEQGGCRPARTDVAGDARARRGRAGP